MIGRLYLQFYDIVVGGVYADYADVVLSVAVFGDYEAAF
jgi:hypothetical protein